MFRIIAACVLFCSYFLSASEEKKQPVLIFMGTRPEAIKLLPLHLALKEANIPTLLCSTGQHQDLLNSALDLFQTRPDVDFAIMKKDQDLFYITQSVLEKAKALMKEVKPALVVVQGDTTSAMAAALAAFYLKIPIAHVEAGLRTYQFDRPYPEEMNRRLISLVASYHFAPTEQAVSHLIQEGIKEESIFLTGNTVVDALAMIQKRITNKELLPSESIVKVVETQKSLKRKLMVLTAHRRESLADDSMVHIFQAIKQALHQHPDLFVIFPAHPNPQIRVAIEKANLHQISNIQIVPPVPYGDMVYLLTQADLIATDSGGIQEEAVSLHKPVLVLRKETDRPESLEGSALLVGTEISKILTGIQTILDTPPNPKTEDSLYGDGQAYKKITEVIKGLLK